MLKRTRGIVLKSTVFGEADLIVAYLTFDYGLMSVFAKSPRKVKSRFGSSLEPLTYSRISFFGKEESTLPRLTQSDIVRPFQSLREDMTCLLNVSEMLELTLTLLPEREPNQEFFHLLLTMLAKLESNRSSRLYNLFYKMQLLHRAGYAPRLDACGRCGRPAAGRQPAAPAARQYHFYVSHGSLLCPRCSDAAGASIRLTGGAARFYQSLLKWNPAAIDRVSPPPSFITEITEIVDAHIRYTLGSLKCTRMKFPLSESAPSVPVQQAS